MAFDILSKPCILEVEKLRPTEVMASSQTSAAGEWPSEDQNPGSARSQPGAFSRTPNTHEPLCPGPPKETGRAQGLNAPGIHADARGL